MFVVLFTLALSPNDRALLLGSGTLADTLLFHVLYQLFTDTTYDSVFGWGKLSFRRLCNAMQIFLHWGYTKPQYHLLMQENCLCCKVVTKLILILVACFLHKWDVPICFSVLGNWLCILSAFELAWCKAAIVAHCLIDAETEENQTKTAGIGKHPEHVHSRTSNDTLPEAVMFVLSSYVSTIRSLQAHLSMIGAKSTLPGSTPSYKLGTRRPFHPVN